MKRQYTKQQKITVLDTSIPGLFKAIVKNIKNAEKLVNAGQRGAAAKILNVMVNDGHGYSPIGNLARTLDAYQTTVEVFKDSQRRLIPKSAPEQQNY